MTAFYVGLYSSIYKYETSENMVDPLILATKITQIVLDGNYKA